ncbi:MAG: bifunctional phosphoribosylaminoimidazolecarboxamide formyltransferase/IMP cyclohydrolase [Propionibacteriaceae bacterium]|jgi:phosphoribosylaminoimidazolecarboxamide formyltransferase/IMP cyclohydrolase|nr:bifunctional phosphoribosylaminoimidazolecarboxamide formyltransferase/IMP cyclohydrolase [Propionibacteriaceae bacterium]
MSDRIPIRRALVSVHDKTGLDELAPALVAAQVAVVSTGATAQRLRQAGCAVTEVAQLTGFPECLDGRVKTLHPVVHAGLLADRRRLDHVAQLARLGIEGFELVVSNLYPFAQTVAAGASDDDCVEQIDIGGPSLVRAAAKNHACVAVVTDPAQYDELGQALAGGGYSLEQRRRLARAAFQRTAAYDLQVAQWMTVAAWPEIRPAADQPPPWLGGAWAKAADLRYGENPHQSAALYRDPAGAGVAQAVQLQGKAMSYNNYTDAEAAHRAVWDFSSPAVAIVKHANPCGLALGDDIAQAHRAAQACDPLSAYGSVVAANRPVTVQMAEQLGPIFTEVVVAPEFEPAALAALAAKPNLRLLRADPYPGGGWEWRRLSGGWLVQRPDRIDAPGDDPASWRLAAGQALAGEDWDDLVFAWRAVRAVKSNAVLLARGRATVGLGMGQVNRVDSCRLAIARAGHRSQGAVAASDAFFPFTDGPELLIDAGAKAIVAPGGSIHDQDVIDFCRQRGMTLYLTGARHFNH